MKVKCDISIPCTTFYRYLIDSFKEQFDINKNDEVSLNHWYKKTLRKGNNSATIEARIIKLEENRYYLIEVKTKEVISTISYLFSESAQDKCSVVYEEDKQYKNKFFSLLLKFNKNERKNKKTTIKSLNEIAESLKQERMIGK